MTLLPDPFAAPAISPEAAPAASAGGGAMTAAIGEVERQFGTLIVSARASIRNRAAAIHPELQPTGYKVLTLLAQQGARQQVELAAELQTDKAMMSRTVKQLGEFGLVECTADPHDGRAKLISITEDARAKYETTIAESRRLLYDRLGTWDQAEVERFAELLARLNETSSAGNPPA
ncbi:winged helix-turn-helix transcriptional regulator [Micrococcaceae bacterium RIT802]|nr:winged helix-turn-helix transcriptional regulator [Micrococcaceae bacterium RIT 802]